MPAGPIPVTPHWEGEFDKEFEELYEEGTAQYPLQEEYFKVVASLEGFDIILPILLADLLILTFSKDSEERTFMISYWQSIKRAAKRLRTRHVMFDPRDARRKIFLQTSDYPVEFDVGLAVPILKGVVCPPSGKVHIDANVKKDNKYCLTRNQYRVLLSALRALGSPILFDHDKTTKKASCADVPKGRVDIKCGEVLASLFFYKHSRHGTPYGYDKNLNGCFNCSIHTVLYAHLAVLKVNKLKGGLWTDTVEWGHIGDLIMDLVKSRIHYHDIWRLLSRPTAQIPGGWDSANAWALKKLQDFDTWPERELIYIPGEVAAIKKETDKWLKENPEPAQAQPPSMPPALAEVLRRATERFYADPPSTTSSAARPTGSSSMARLSIRAPVAGPSGRSASVHRFEVSPSPPQDPSDQEAERAAKVLAGLGGESTSSDREFIDDDSDGDQTPDEVEPEAHISDITDSSDDGSDSADGDHEASDPTFLPLRRNTRSQARETPSDDLELGTWSAPPSTSERRKLAKPASASSLSSRRTKSFVDDVDVEPRKRTRSGPAEPKAGKVNKGKGKGNQQVDEER